MSRYPLVRLVLALVAGMAVAWIALPVGSVGGGAWTAALAALTVTLLLTAGGPVHRRVPWLFGVVALLLTATFGAALLAHQRDTLAGDARLLFRAAEAGRTFRARVVSPLEARGNSYVIDLRVGRSVVQTRLAADKRTDSLAVGDSVVFRPLVLYPAIARPDTLDPEFAGHRRRMLAAGKVATAYVHYNGWALLRHADTARESLWERASAWLLDVRLRLHGVFVSHGMTDAAGAVVEAMTTGRRTLPLEHVRDRYSRAGVSHVLALSGFHLNVLYLIYSLVVLRILPFRARRWAALAFIVLMWVFVVLAYAPASLRRAAIMCTVLQIAFFTERSHHFPNACALAALVMLVVNPLLIVDAGFQLSFASVVGIGIALRPVDDLCRRATEMRGLLSDFFFSSVAICLTCSVFTLPLVAYHFGYVPVLSVLSNLLVALLAWVVMLCAALWFALLWWPAAAALVQWVLSAAASAMNGIASTVAALPFATFDFRPDVLETALCYVVLFCLIALWRGRTA